PTKSPTPATEESLEERERQREMQAALRSASRRAAAAASHRGVTTTTTSTITEADKKWVESLVQREVRTQMLEAEWSARLRAVEREVEAPWEWLRPGRRASWRATSAASRAG
ncbi:unnamed protein product, partial [Urochloa humidicola]